MEQPQEQRISIADIPFFPELDSFWGSIPTLMRQGDPVSRYEVLQRVIKEARENHGGIVRFRGLFEPLANINMFPMGKVFWIMHPWLVAEILSYKGESRLTKDGVFPIELLRMLGYGVIAEDPNTERSHRKKGIMVGIDKYAEDPASTEFIRGVIEEHIDSWGLDVPFSPSSHAASIISRIAFHMLMGDEIYQENYHIINPLVARATSDVNNIALQRMIFKWSAYLIPSYRAHNARVNELDKFWTEKITLLLQEYRSKGGAGVPAMIAGLFKHFTEYEDFKEQKLEDVEIVARTVAEVKAAILAGQETAQLVLSALFAEMPTLYGWIEEKIQEGREESDVLNAVVHYILLKASPTPVAPRNVKEEFEVPIYGIENNAYVDTGKRLVIPKGTTLFLNIADAQLDPVILAQWGGLTPELFLEDNPNHSEVMNHFKVFGASPHVCIGSTLAIKELKIALSVLVERARNGQVLSVYTNPEKGLLNTFTYSPEGLEVVWSKSMVEG